jgi:hypothetical protein
MAYPVDVLSTGGWRSLVAAVAVGTALLAGSATPASAAAPDATQAAVLGEQAYEYGFPLVDLLRIRAEMTSVACPDGRGNAPVNSFSHATGFATADDRTVVLPNTDTLYSLAHLDLKKGPITLSHPDMGKRYFSFELVDPWTNVIAIPGKREDGPDAASYVVKWKGEGSARPPASFKKPKGAEVIKSKYRRVWVIGRTLATDAKSDQKKAKKKMRKYELALPDGKPRKFPKGCNPGEPKTFPTPTDGEPFIEKLSADMAKNPPPARDNPLLEQLATVGVGAGLSPEDAGLSPDALAAFYDAIAAKAAALPTETRLFAYTEALKTDGWFLAPPNIGDFGTDYFLRAIVASAGIGANTPNEAIYPVAIADRNGALFSGANDYRLTFAADDLPPARFFWSVTMYDTEGFLVPNPDNLYSVGPSHGDLVAKPDGSIVVVISRTEPTEGGVNWLPAPDAGFRLNMRLYGPSKAAQTGAWMPPGVEKLTPP